MDLDVGRPVASAVTGMNTVKPILVGLAIGATIAAGATAAPARGYPGNPFSSCESVGNYLYCDQSPTRPNGTWARCYSWQPSWAPPTAIPPGAVAPGTSFCQNVGPGIGIPVGPPHHIG